MAVFLLPISIFSATLLLKFGDSILNEVDKSFRRAFILSLIIHACLIFSFNEILSVFNGINAVNALVFWGLVVLIEAYLLYISFRKTQVREDFKNYTGKILIFKNISGNRLTIYAGLLLYGVPLFLLAAMVPPNNFDAHSYHLSRIIEWLGNGNVNHFATRHIQQLYHNVFSEYMVMHTYLLAGTDRFAGFVQFFACLGSILGVSLVAKKLGASVSIQVLCSIMLLTLPIGIFESTSVQVDYVACFFFISFLYFGYEALDTPRKFTIFAMALSLAFGAFSKYTIFMYALPFSIYFGLMFIRQKGVVPTAGILITFLIVMSVVFTPFMTRNYQFFGNVLSPVEGHGLETERLSVEEFSLAATASGILKNASLHIGLPVNSYNTFVKEIITRIHEVFGFNVNDPRYSMDPFTVRFDVHEDMVPNNIHFILILVSILALFFIKTSARLKWFTICALIGFTIFSSMMVFQLWSTRTHMPFFAMGCILAAFVFGRLLQQKTIYLSFFLLAASVVFVFGNPSKPLLPLAYYSKKMLSHAPVAICPRNERQADAVRQKLGKYYDTVPNDSYCFALKQNPTKEERDIIFQILDSAGYYDDEKYETVFDLSHDKMYFLSHPANYENFEGLITPLKNTDGNVGILFKGGNGFYHYWSVVQTEKFNFGQMQYIGYRPKYAGLENAKREFRYNYIFGDDPSLLSPFYEKQVIDTVFYSKKFYLAKLKKPSSDKILIED